MFSLLDRIPNGVEPMLRDMETYVVHNGVEDMKFCAELITSVSDCEERGRGGRREAEGGGERQREEVES